MTGRAPGAIRPPRAGARVTTRGRARDPAHDEARVAARVGKENRVAPVLLALLLTLAPGCAVPPADPARTDAPASALARPAPPDRETSRAAARAYRAAARRAYPVPGPPGDPWGPHLRTAAARFDIPERWVRAIMAVETGGRLHDGAGRLVTSPVGAMGLMQVMPETWESLRARHGLGPDPYDPRDNILAGAAYIRDMRDRFGVPGFVAAYNAGPDRVEAVLAGAMILPDETMGYLARVVPNLGVAVGPWPEVADGPRATTPDDPSLRAYEGGGLVPRDADAGSSF